MSVAAVHGDATGVLGDGARLLPVDVAGYNPHPLHAAERVWAQTNCYVDLWIEVLHAAGLDPVPALSVALEADFDGTQWTFLKLGPEDLRRLHGVTVAELNLWRPVLDHVVEELARGRLLTVEVDSFWLPDTRGTDYHEAHAKTTIVVNEVDLAGLRVAYFHNDGYHAASGEDVVGLFHLAGRAPNVLLPYVEVVRLEGAHDPTPDEVVEVFISHVAAAPVDNPVARLAARVREDVGWLHGAGLTEFHRWSFGVLRQCGFTAELGADACDRVAGLGVRGAAAAGEELRATAEAAKAAQFRVARIARGRNADVGSSLEQMAECWARATDHLSPLRP